MALEDILFPDGDPQNIILTLNRGNIGLVDDVVTEGNSNSGMLLNEVPEIIDTSSNAAFTWVG